MLHRSVHYTSKARLIRVAYEARGWPRSDSPPEPQRLRLVSSTVYADWQRHADAAAGGASYDSMT
jgi:hypothetical protein